MHLPQLTDLDRFAFFLDFDGTLVPIAPTPDAVVLDARTHKAVTCLQQRLDNALAIVTGRDIATIDQYFAPARLSVAGVHGTVRRNHAGETIAPRVASDLIDALASALQPLLSAHPGLLLEHKHGSLALHYRKAPELEAACIAAMSEAIAGITGGELKRGHCVVEAKLLPGDKGSAIRAFLEEAPFLGRTPVFAGDDVTDEDAFAVVNATGGISIKIGSGPSRAQYRAADSATFTDWLAGLAASSGGGCTNG